MNGHPYQKTVCILATHTSLYDRDDKASNVTCYLKLFANLDLTDKSIFILTIIRIFQCVIIYLLNFMLKFIQ